MDAKKRQVISEQLSAYLDDELSPVEVGRVAGALSEDAELARELEELRATRELLRRLPREKAGEDFAAQVLARAERIHLVGVAAVPAPRRRFSWARRLTAAAVLLVAAGIGAVVGMQFWPGAAVKAPTHSPATPVADIARDKLPAGPSEIDGRREVVGKTGGNGDRDGTLTKGGALVVNGSTVHKNGELPGSPPTVFCFTNEVVNTKEVTLPETQREVESILAFNSIEPVTIEADRLAVRSKSADRFRGNFSQRQTRANQATYTLVGTPEQLANVRKSLDKLRLRQTVSQEAPIAMGASLERQVKADAKELLVIAGVQDGRFALEGEDKEKAGKPAKLDDGKKPGAKPSLPASPGGPEGASVRDATRGQTRRPDVSKAGPGKGAEDEVTKTKGAATRLAEKLTSEVPSKLKAAPPSPAPVTKAKDNDRLGGTEQPNASGSRLARTDGDDFGKAPAARAKQAGESQPAATQATSAPATQPGAKTEQLAHKRTRQRPTGAGGLEKQMKKLGGDKDEGDKKRRGRARQRFAATRPAGRKYWYQQRDGANVCVMIITLNGVPMRPAFATTRRTAETRSAEDTRNANKREQKEPASKPAE